MTSPTSTYLCKRSAAQFWKHNWDFDFVQTTRSVPTARSGARASEDEALEVCRQLGLSLPLEVMVTSASKRACGEHCSCHVWKGDFPFGSFVKTEYGAYMASPELTFLQAAERLDILHLVAYGFELCGDYAVSADNPWGGEDVLPSAALEVRSTSAFDSAAASSYAAAVSLWKDAPSTPSKGALSAGASSGDSPSEGASEIVLSAGASPAADSLLAESSCIESGILATSPSRTLGSPISARQPQGSSFANRSAVTDARKLRRYLERCTGRYGAAKARRAARYVLDGSASPMETALAMLLYLPHALGGYALPIPKMNHSISLGPTDAARFGCDSLRADLYWPERHVAVEYDSTRHHAADVDRQRDAGRRNAMQFGKDVVFTVTPDQVRSVTKLYALAKGLGGKLGKPLDIRVRNFDRRNADLRRVVVPFWPASGS